MLTCIYHPIDAMQVVEDHEAEQLVASGVWFNSPKDAKEYREKVEMEIKTEPESNKAKAKIEGKKS